MRRSLIGKQSVPRLLQTPCGLLKPRGP